MDSWNHGDAKLIEEYRITCLPPQISEAKISATVFFETDTLQTMRWLLSPFERLVSDSDSPSPKKKSKNCEKILFVKFIYFNVIRRKP